MASAASSQGLVPPRTLLTLKHPIVAFAQDGSRIAWTTSGSCPFVHLQVLATGRRYSLTPATGETCSPQDAGAGVLTSALALAGSRAIWVVDGFSNSSEGLEVVTGRPGSRDVAIGFNEFACRGQDCGGKQVIHLASLAGAGSTLVWALPGGDDSGTVERLAGKKAVSVGGLAGGRLVATDGSMIAAAGRSPGGATVTENPAWSPVAGKVAFDSLRDGTVGIYVVGAAGGTWKRVASGWNPAWSPGGKQLAYVDSRTDVLHVLDLQTGRSRALAPSRDDADAPAWSPDGKEIAFGALDGIYVVGADGKGLRRLFKDPNGDYQYELTNPSWSPDGTRIAYVSSNNNAAGLYVGRADGSSTQLIASSGAGDDPSWSPDGKELAVGGCSIDVLNADGSSRRTVVPAPSSPKGNCADHPSWSPDGTSIVFQEGELDTNTDLWIVNADGSGLRRLTTTIPTTGADYVDVLTSTNRKVASLTTKAGAIAISQSVLALLRSSRIFLYSPRERLLRTVNTPGAAPQLSLSGTQLVFRVGRSIRLLDTANGTVRTVAQAASVPIGLSISGSRIAWAENVGGHGRIVALQLS
ncbi:MAG TPA: DPP IV N-terminal domain-containing protein [Gaiellaceae bacterium]|nr:DPP IV N-terminal domain-containing protein [Gaiellaceae bacterium]